MTIQQLLYILEVSRTGSISQAAKNLYVAQPSISNAVSALENELGFPIFSRSWQGMTPTERGQKVLIHASHICEHHRLMLDETPPLRRNVIIGTPLYLPCCEAFTQLAEEYRHREDIVLSHIFCREQSDALNRLLTRDLDLYITCVLRLSGRSIHFPEDKSKLEWTHHRTIPAVVRIGPGHRLYHQSVVTPEDLDNDTIIDTTESYLVRAGILSAFINIDPERVIFSSERLTRYDMVRRGLGYIIGPQFPAHIDQQFGFRNIPLEGLEYHVFSAVNAGRPIRSEVQRYLDIMNTSLDQFPRS